MNQQIFIFILILILTLIIFNEQYEKKHNNISFFQEKKTKKALGKIILADDIMRIFDFIFKIGSFF